MTPVNETHRFRRIVVTLNGSPAGPLALDIAVRLAAALGAELEGIFIEDINLMRLADLPFLREVRAHSLVEQAISAADLQRDLHLLARQAESKLQRAAAAGGVRCSFRVWRGHARLETLNSSFEADILSLGGTGMHSAHHAFFQLPWRSPQAPAIETVNVLFNDSDQGHRTLTAACQLAGSLGARLNVLLPAGVADAAPERQAAAVLAMHAAGPAMYIRFDADDAQALITRIGKTAGRVVVIGSDDPLLYRAGLARWLETLSGPLLLVR